MKYYSIDLSGNKELELKFKDIPQPLEHEVLIKMHAWSLNYRDLLVQKNAYGLTETSLIPLSDGAGEIVEIGNKVNKFKVGERVSPIFMQEWFSGKINNKHPASALGGARNGLLSEYVCISENSLVKIPEYLTYEQAACLPCAGVTAYNSLAYSNKFNKDDSVLILGTGGVSTFALQFVKALKGKSIVTSKSEEKLEQAIKLGANYTINYSQYSEWDTKVLEIFPDGVQQIIEVGGAGTLNKSLSVSEYGGTISLIGVLTGVNSEINTANILRKNIKVQGIFVGSRECFEQMNLFLEQHQIIPVIDNVFKFDDADQAYKYLEKGIHQGKIVISI